MTDVRPGLLFHCQHSLGLGHLVRSFALAEALAERFRVTFLCGGALPRELAPPRGIELVPLPPLAADDAGALVSHSAGVSLESALELRRARILAAFQSVQPAAVVVELFPFGRKKLAGELLPLLEAARGARAVVVCSVRDVLVRGREQQDRHDERACAVANQYLDAVLVHADPRFARLDETFRPRTTLAVPVHHTGFVVRTPARAVQRQPRVVVSAGGGRFGGRLFAAAVVTQRLLPEMRMTIVAGPFAPVHEWEALRAAAYQVKGLEVRRSVSDLGAELASASASVSQCGYNTALDLVQARVPALVVPFADGGEDEQTRRAERLARLGTVRVLHGHALDAETLAAEVRALRTFRPAPFAFDLDGAAASAQILSDLVAGRARGAA